MSIYRCSSSGWDELGLDWIRRSLALVFGMGLSITTCYEDMNVCMYISCTSSLLDVVSSGVGIWGMAKPVPPPTRCGPDECYYSNV